MSYSSMFHLVHFTFHLSLILSNASSRTFSIEQDGDLLERGTFCLDKEEVDNKTFDDQAGRSC